MKESLEPSGAFSEDFLEAVPQEVGRRGIATPAHGSPGPCRSSSGILIGSDGDPQLRKPSVASPSH